MLTRIVRALIPLAAAVTALALAAPVAADDSPRIIDGRPATEAYPWMAALLGPGGGQFCGATLIKSQWVLTASHCLHGDPRIRVRVGSKFHDTGGELVSAAYSVTGSADLSLIKLDRPVTAAPPEMITTTPPPGTPTRILGWGSTCKPGTSCFPRDLRELDTTIAPDQQCRTLDGRYEVCVAAANGKGTCYGDSGGPFLIKQGTAWRVGGSASRLGGQGCGGSSIYSNVVDQYEFIKRFTST